MPTKEVIGFFLQGGIPYALRDSSYVLSFTQLIILILIDKNEIAT